MAHSEIKGAGEDFGLSVHYIYVNPMKDEGDKQTIGRAWNTVLPWIKESKTDYLAVADCDTRFSPSYFADLTGYLDNHQNIGAVAGCIEGERRYDHMPMGTGKLVRWDVVESIEKFWDLEPDSFFNIKSMALGHHNKSLDIPVESRPTTLRVGFDLAYRLYYCGNSILVASLKALRLRDREVFTHFISLRWNGAGQTDDLDARYYYSKRRILKSLFRRSVSV